MTTLAIWTVLKIPAAVPISLSRASLRYRCRWSEAIGQRHHRAQQKSGCAAFSLLKCARSCMPRSDTASRRSWRRGYDPAAVHPEFLSCGTGLVGRFREACWPQPVAVDHPAAVVEPVPIAAPDRQAAHPGRPICLQPACGCLGDYCPRRQIVEVYAMAGVMILVLRAGQRSGAAWPTQDEPLRRMRSPACSIGHMRRKRSCGTASFVPSIRDQANARALIARTSR